MPCALSERWLLVRSRERPLENDHLPMYVSTNHPLAIAAVDAIHFGNVVALKRLLDENLDLATVRLVGDTNLDRCRASRTLVANKWLIWLTNVLFNLNLSDMETGYKAIRKSALKKIVIRENRFGVGPELTAKLA